MQTRAKLFFSIVLILLVALNGFSQVSEHKETKKKKLSVVNYDQDQYEVYEEIISQQVGDLSGNTLVIALELSDCSLGIWKENLIDAGIPSKNVNEIEDYCFTGKDKKEVLSSKGLKLKSNLVLLKFAEIKKFFFRVNCQDGWEKFYKKYPNSNGNMGLSRVGFDKEKKYAVVHYGNQKQCVDGEGLLFVLKKSQKEWEIVHRQPTCMS